jgi:uncharacterized protein
MIRGRRPKSGKPVPHELPVLHVIADGVVVGLVTGLVGAGGGFLVVPALALLGGLPMPVAVGTSLLVIAMKSFAGLAGYLSNVHINWALAAAVTAAAILGSLAGSRLAGRIPETILRKSFGWFVAVMGVFVLAQQLPSGLYSNPILWAIAAGLAAAGGAWALARRRRRPAAQHPTPRTEVTGHVPPSSAVRPSADHHGAPS